MPGNLSAASPSTVLPEGLCLAFEQRRRYEANVNEYANGESQREVKASSPRRAWSQTRALTAAALATLLSFYAARKGGLEPFYFYDPSESTTYGNYDGTGASSNGRFIVAFRGPLGFTLAGGRAQVSFQIEEVA